MRKELQEKLYSDFPELYADRKAKIQESCMPWGFDCGDGWFDLIYWLSGRLKKIFPEVRATQVKEKYGGLRFYIRFDGVAPGCVITEAYKLIDFAERESYLICEDCGSRDGVKQTEGWIYTRCQKCLNKMDDEKI